MTLFTNNEAIMIATISSIVCCCICLSICFCKYRTGIQFFDDNETLDGTIKYVSLPTTSLS